jgi:L-cysteine:1D-myo-inositol 2-amino-2-deoxy-alpha-D-glucopyranoside ligase
MDRNVERLGAWRVSADGRASDLIDVVRERLDDDLDSPGAVAAVDAAAAAGESTRAAADLLGVTL